MIFYNLILDYQVFLVTAHINKEIIKKKEGFLNSQQASSWLLYKDIVFANKLFYNQSFPNCRNMLGFFHPYYLICTNIVCVITV